MNIFINQGEGRPRAGWRLLLQLLMMVFIIGLLAMVSQLIWSTSLIVYSVLPMLLGVLGSVWAASRLLDKRPLSDYGIDFDTQWRKEALVGAVIAAVAVGIIFLIEWATGWLAITGYGWQASSETSFGLGFTSSLLGMLMVGFYEELFSRGYQVLNLTEGLRYPGIGARGAVVIATLLASSLFGLMHLYNPNASAVSTFNIILAGVVLAIPYILTGSLALSVGLHFGWNFTMGGIAGFPVSGQKFESSILQISQGGTEVWTGGHFGPEAGFLGLLGMAIMLGLSYVYITAAGYELTIAESFKKEYQPAVKSDEQGR